MAVSIVASALPLAFSSSFRQTRILTHHSKCPQIVPSRQTLLESKQFLSFRCPSRLILHENVRRASPNGFVDRDPEEEVLRGFEDKPVKFLFWVVVWASLSLAWFAASGEANAAANSIKASSFGLKFAAFLRSSGWPDEAVVFALATLPVIELRGAIPVGYWLQLNPLALTVLSVLGNMVPVPLIILYLKRLASFLAGRNETASRFLNSLFERAKAKAGPVEEFQWLGLMLFVAVPFPGTGAWTGAIIASVLDMPFWAAVSANFFGVVLAGLLVNLLVSLGLKYACITGVLLFIVSTFMWSVLGNMRKSFSRTCQ